MGGGGFLSEAGLRERAQAQGRVFGAGGREFEFGLFGFGTLVLLGSSVEATSSTSLVLHAVLISKHRLLAAL